MKKANPMAFLFKQPNAPKLGPKSMGHSLTDLAGRV
jgi:hypothetical protein